MREMRFRAWHKGNKGFSYFTLAEMWKNGFHVAQSTEYGNKDDIKRGPEGLYATESFFGSAFMGHVFCLNVAEWEQFTGLLDKNGKEIWEGDCLSKDYPFDKKYPTVTETGEVKFMGGGFCLWFEDDHDAWHYLQETHSRHYVVGNIHANPELLK